jgi:Terpene cyclase DEP1
MRLNMQEAIPMSRPSKLLCSAYGLIAVAALIAINIQNAAFTAERGLSIVAAFPAFPAALLANHATISITIDILLVTLAGIFWLVFEARRLGIRFAWLYVFFGIFFAISFTFPLFLLARERRLAEASVAPQPEVGGGLTDVRRWPGALDYLGLGIVSVGTLAFAAYCAQL